MEFPFDVNSLLVDTISKIDSSLKINGKKQPSVNKKDVRSQLLTIIDDIGIASAKAQDLQTPVTSAEKFQTSEHVIYLMKDKDGNKGRGTVVGILKVGHKKLFLLDFYGNQNELTPKCILDFYIHESQQRKGFGKILFDFMLKDENLKPHDLAIDRPSSKFLFFLKKHYNLHETIPQVNNFTIFTEFFSSNTSPSKETTSTAIPCQHPRRRNSLDFGSLPEEKGTWFLTEVAVRNPSKASSRASFPITNKNTYRKSIDLTGKPKQNDSSLNIFGVPASWTQPSCSVKSQHSVQP